jgi:hypothetical protein
MHRPARTIYVDPLKRCSRVPQVDHKAGDAIARREGDLMVQVCSSARLTDVFEDAPLLVGEKRGACYLISCRV